MAADASGSGEKRRPSWGNVDDQHWSRTRREMNEEALEYYRERSKAPGVAEGGGLRNVYCMECDGVIPVEYDRAEPADRGAKRTCPHCGVELDASIQRMFNWVEIDRAPPSDVRALLPLALGALAVLAALAAAVVWLVAR